MIDFILNRNDGQDVLHRNPAMEQCNLDDAKARSHVDPKTAAALVSSGQAKTCEHCMPLVDGEHL